MTSNKGLKLFLALFTIIGANLFTLRQAKAALTNEGHFVTDLDGKYYQQLKSYKEITVDHRNSLGFEVYGPIGLSTFLQKLNIPFNDLESAADQKSSPELADYPKSAQVEKYLKDLVAANPNIMRLESLGKTLDGKDLWIVKVSDNPNIDEKEPEFKYVANMHGDEIVGRELMIKLLEDLAKGFKNNDPFIKHLVEQTEIYIMPSMNPDGADKHQRGNSRYVDLNRNFPDFTTDDRTNTSAGRQPETQALMKLATDHFFALSANFHGGAVVFNYPWDTTPNKHPLEAHTQEIGLEYASLVPDMRNSSQFPNGIVNGYTWYEVNGGMQDWSYNWHGDLQNTIELSDVKWPAYEQMDAFYKDNKESLLNHIQRVHQGAGAYFADSKTKGQYRFENLDTKVSYGPTPFDRGEFYKVLPDGKYRLFIEIGAQKLDPIEVTVDYDHLATGKYFSMR